MATTDAKAFTDTNVLLRATLIEFPEHKAADALIKQQLRDGVELWISRQVVREYTVQATRGQIFMKPLTIEEVERHIAVIRTTFKIADETEAVMLELFRLLKAYPGGGKQVHDTNIVATMLTHGVGTLLTANTADFQRFATEIQVVPLPTV